MSWQALSADQKKKLMQSRLLDFQAFVLDSLHDGLMDDCGSVEEALESAMEVYLDLIQKDDEDDEGDEK